MIIAEHSCASSIDAVHQKDEAGTLPTLPSESRFPLAPRKTARIFALLSPVESPPRSRVSGVGGVLA
jgi:hypothetical protein